MIKKVFRTIGLLIISCILGVGIIVGVLWLSVDHTPDDKVIQSFIENRQDFVDAKDYIVQNKDINRIRSNSYDKDQKSLVKLFETLKYGAITKTDNGEYVYFVRVSQLGFTQGIVFSASGNVPISSYITETKKIEDGWFLYKMK